MSSYFPLLRAQSARNRLLFGVEAVHPDSPHDQPHQFALFLERKFFQLVIELPQRLGDLVFIGHRSSSESDLDFHLLKLPLKLVLLLREILGGGKGFLPEVPGARLTSQHEVAGQ